MAGPVGRRRCSKSGVLLEREREREGIHQLVLRTLRTNGVAVGRGRHLPEPLDGFALGFFFFYSLPVAQRFASPPSIRAECSSFQIWTIY